jgi:hypothetical protein
MMLLLDLKSKKPDGNQAFKFCSLHLQHYYTISNVNKDIILCQLYQ